MDLSEIHDLWSPGGLWYFLWRCSLHKQGPSQRKVGAACWRLQPVASSWPSSRARATALSFGHGRTFLKLWLASLCFVLAACFSTLPASSSKYLPLCIAPHMHVHIHFLFQFTCSFSFLLYFWGVWYAQTFASTLCFCFLHFPWVHFCHVYVHSRYHPLVCVCTVFLKPPFSWLAHNSTICGFYHMYLGNLEHWKCENALPVDRTFHSYIIFCHKLAFCQPIDKVQGVAKDFPA